MSAASSLLLVVALWFVLVLGCSTSQRSDSGSSANPSATPYSVNVVEFLRDYNDNEVSADAIYKNRRLALIGTVESIGKDILDTPYVTLSSDGEVAFPSAQCMFGEESLNQLGGLRKGMKITVEGTCQGKMGNVLLRDCVIR